MGRLQVVDEGGPLLGVSQPYHQIHLTGLHLFECPSPGHPFEGEHNAAACLQLAQNVDIQPWKSSFSASMRNGGQTSVATVRVGAPCAQQANNRQSAPQLVLPIQLSPSFVTSL